MEDKKKTGETLFKVRSYLECLKEGIKLPTQHILPLLRFLYPSLLVGALCAVLCGLFFNRQAIVMQQWVGAGMSGQPDVPVLAVIALAVLSLLSFSFYLGQLMVVVAHYAASGQFPALRFGAVYKEVLHTSLRALTFILIALLILTPLSLLVTDLLGLFSVWNWVLQALLYLVFLLPFLMVGLDYMLNSSHSFRDSLRFMKEGYQYWVAIFIVLLCSGLIQGVFNWVAGLPVAILAYAENAFTVAILNGDATDLPGWVPVVSVMFWVLCLLIMAIASWVEVFSLSFLYGTVEARKAERARYKEEEERLVEKYNQ